MKTSTVGVSATAFLAVAIVGASIVLADTANTGTLRRLYDFPHGDRVGHVLLYGTVTLLVALALVRAFPERDPRAVALWTAITIAVLLALEELSQVWLPSRSADPVDLLASYLGVGLAGSAVLRFGRSRAAV